MKSDLPEVRVSVEELRRIFNESAVPEGIRSGLYRIDVVRSNHADPERSGQVYCTQSQTVDYLDTDDNVVVRVHQYLLPDGNIGGSGRPDPKRLVLENTVYKLMRAARTDTPSP